MSEASDASAPKQDELKTLLKQAEQGDTTVLPALRAYMDPTPGYWEQRGDMAHAMQVAVIQQAAGKNLMVQESLARQGKALTQELAGPTPSPRERVLVERIVLCWLHLHCAAATSVMRKELSIRQAEFHQARISQAQARSRAAIRTLARVRRLGVPAVQVNIGQQQVIAGS